MTPSKYCSCFQQAFTYSFVVEGDAAHSVSEGMIVEVERKVGMKK
jgi:hypothetical protein